MKIILILGSSGFIGKNLSIYFSKLKNYRCYGTYHTNNPKDSWEFIVRLGQRFEKDEFKILQIQNSNTEKSPATYIESIKAVKKDNITPSNSQAMAFGTIPGVSFKMGEIILKKYGTLGDLFDTYLGLETEEEKEKLLEKIQISEKRKLGKILSARIYKFLFK